MDGRGEGTRIDETSLTQGLSRDEDDELRRLNYMAQHGMLSPRSRERILELRMRDRRLEIRAPREFEAPECPGGSGSHGPHGQSLGRAVRGRVKSFFRHK
jgi:hypothetical protein